MLNEIADGRTDLVFEYFAAGNPATATDRNGVSLLNWCAYYGDVSAMKFLLSRGESFDSLGENLGLGAACFHGHWRLCKFLIESGADVNRPSPENGETALHSALCKANSPAHTLVLRVLLAHGANPNARPSRAWKQTASCAIAAPKAKLRCIARRRSARRRRFSFYSTRAQRSMQKT